MSTLNKELIIVIITIIIIIIIIIITVIIIIIEQLRIFVWNLNHDNKTSLLKFCHTQA